MLDWAIIGTGIDRTGIINLQFLVRPILKLGLIAALCRIVRREIGARRCLPFLDGNLGDLINPPG
jgi:hypothetical protein